MEAIIELIGLIYDSVADASRWQIFLETFVRAVRAQAGTLAIFPTPNATTVSCRTGYSADDIRQYMDLCAATDPWRIYGGKLPDGTVAADFEFCPREEMEASAAFREFYAPRDYVHGVGGIILNNNLGQSAISVSRGVKDGPFGESEKAILRRLLPHLRRAALLHGELGSVRTQLNTFAGHLDRYPYAFLLADAERRVLYANKPARELAQRNDGFAIEAGRVSLSSPKQNLALQKEMRKMSSERDDSLQRVDVLRPSRKTPYRLLLMPVETSNFIPLGVSLPAVSLLIIDSESQHHPDPAVLRALFSLTPAEANITARLVLGRNLEEIAAEAGTSYETVRTHLKHILSKTETKRQGELIALVLRSTPFRFH